MLRYFGARLPACFICLTVVALCLTPVAGATGTETATVNASFTVVAPPFTDIADHPDAPYIADLAELGIVCGYGDGRFGPDDLMTREQFAKVIVLASKASEAPLDLTGYADYSRVGPWARGYLGVAVKLGWIRGIGENKLDPRGYLTRAQALTVIGRMLGDSSASGPTPFSDDAQIPDWARTAVCRSVTDGICGPTDFARLEPARFCTRGEVARFTARFVAKRASE